MVLARCSVCSTWPTERGAALIVALVIVAVMATLAVTLSDDFLLLFRRVENRLQGDQAYARLLGAEAMARRLLLEDKAVGAPADSLDELWAQPLELPLAEGEVRMQLHDAQGLININGLSAPAGQEGWSAEQRRLVRLLRFLRDDDDKPLLDEEQSTALANAIFDWLDGDNDPRLPGGAEAYDYSSDPGVRPANGELVHPSELRWVRGVNAQVYAALMPWLVALPGQGGGVNINTAPAMVLASLGAPDDLEPLSERAVERLMELREVPGGVELDALALEPDLSTLDRGGLVVASDWFVLEAEVEMRGRVFHHRALLQRDGERVSVRQRWPGGE